MTGVPHSAGTARGGEAEVEVDEAEQTVVQ